MSKRKQDNSQPSPSRPTRVEARNRTTSSTRGGTNSRAKRKPTSNKAKPNNSRFGFKLPSFNFKWPTFRLNLRRRALVLGLLLLVSVVMLVLSLLSRNQGWLTGGILNLLNWLFGWFQPVMLLLSGVGSLFLIVWGMERPLKGLTAVRFVGVVMLLAIGLAQASMLALYLNNGLNNYDAVVTAQVGGGLLGSLLAQLMTEAAGTMGAMVVFTAVGLLAAVMATGLRLDDFQRVYAAWRAKRAAPEEIMIGGHTAVSPPQPSALPLFAPRRASPSKSDKDGESPTNQDPPSGESDTVERWVEPARPAHHPPVASDPDEGKSRRASRRRSRPKATPEAEAEPASLPPLILGRGDTQNLTWKLPNLTEMLNLGEEYINNNDHIREQTQIIEETLISFGAPGQVVDVLPGPTLVQYCVEPLYLEQRSGRRTKVKVGKIASLADDLALALAARSVRIQAPVPGKGYVGIEVPNEAKALVSLRDVMASSAFAKMARKSPLAIGLGQDVAGVPIVADLAKMPHMLIAGATGSGKSVCVNTIIACLLLQNTPEELQMVMVDPKRVELTGYNGIPHLAAPVVVDMERVVGTLQWALREMDSRYRQFAEVGARNIDDFNKKVAGSSQNKGEKLPFIIIIIDELADLMMIAPEDTEKSIARLAQMARATGIHLILATQRPSVDVVTGLIKANFPSRIAFAVASSIDSRVVLDTTGAERLLGQGDMLFQAPDAPAPLRMQGCFVSDGELNKLIDYWQSARRLASMRREMNVITAVSDAIPKTELDQAVWDVDEDDPQSMVKKGTGKNAGLGTREVDMNTAVSPADEAYPTTPSQLAKPTPAAPQPVLYPELEEEILAEQAKALANDHPVDELWEEAVALVRELGKASTSLLQRRFRIGYTRASRLIDHMEEADIIGEATGTSKARVVFDADGQPLGRGGDTDDDEDENESE